MSSDHQHIKWRINIAENFNPLSRVHERYRRQTDDGQTDGRRHIANMNMSSPSLKRKMWRKWWRSNCTFDGVHRSNTNEFWEEK